MIESSNQFSFIKKKSTIRASFRLIKILIEKGPRYSNSFYERERERKNFSLIFLIKKEKYNGSYWIKSIFFFYLHTSPSIIPKEGAKRVAISQGWEEMVVEFPRKLYFPYVRSREATAFVLKKKKKDRSAENGVSFFGSQMRFSSSGERWVTPLARSSWWTSRITQRVWRMDERGNEFRC